MTYVAADGPPDVDATHAWTPASGVTPPIINNWTADPVTLPFAKLDRITNWRAAPDADDFREPSTIQNLEIGYPGGLLGKTVVYEGEVRAASRESCRATITGLVNGYGDRSGLGTMTVTPFSSIGGVVWQYKARVLAFEPDPEMVFERGKYGPFRHGFQLSLRMLDPRFYTPALGGTAYL